jgi:hypothetical protein
LDLNSISIAEATGHLRSVEERKKKFTGGAKEGRLLLTEDEWMACLNMCEGESGSGADQGDRGRHGGGRGCRGRGSTPDSQEDGT